MRIYIDTETTGLDERWDKVIEVAAIQFWDDGTLGRSFHSLCHPGLEVLDSPRTDRALEINGITREMLQPAPPLDEVARGLQQYIDSLEAHIEAVTYHSYNIAFDSKFLACAPWSLGKGIWGDCVMLKFAKRYDPYRGKWQKLSKAAEFYNLEWPGDAHRARADALMAGRVHLAMLEERRGVDA